MANNINNPNYSKDFVFDFDEEPLEKPVEDKQSSTKKVEYGIDDPEYAIHAFFNRDGSVRESSFDVKNPYYTVNKVFNSDGTKKTNYGTQAYNRSKNVPPVRNVRRKRSKMKEIIKIAKKTIIVVGIIVIGSKVIVNNVNLSNKEYDIRTEVGQLVSDNTITFGYNPNEQKPYWDYNIDGIAKGILNENQEYDVDTRIYLTYDRLNAYKKVESMDKIFESMSRIIGFSPESFDDDVFRSCLFDTFQEYLDSKDLTEEKWIEKMREIVKSYAKSDVSEEKTQDLVDKLNHTGGGR